MKVVLDTNVLISGIFWGGNPLRIIELWQRNKINALASEPILDEYLKSIERIALKVDKPDLFSAWSLVLPTKIHLVGVKKKFLVCRDVDDNKFIDCAVSGKAKYLISGDQDLLVLKSFMNLDIVSPSRFLKLHSG